jgi:hypothetical protein
LTRAALHLAVLRLPWPRAPVHRDCARKSRWWFGVRASVACPLKTDPPVRLKEDIEARQGDEPEALCAGADHRETAVSRGALGPGGDGVPGLPYLGPCRADFLSLALGVCRFKRSADLRPSASPIAKAPSRHRAKIFKKFCSFCVSASSCSGFSSIITT